MYFVMCGCETLSVILKEQSRTKILVERQHFMINISHEESCEEISSAYRILVAAPHWQQ
jgi:hypothetical protein